MRVAVLDRAEWHDGMCGARQAPRLPGYGPGFTVRNEYRPSASVEIAAKPWKLGSSGAGLGSLGCA